jgi:hypothetical protein
VKDMEDISKKTVIMLFIKSHNATHDKPFRRRRKAILQTTKWLFVKTRKGGFANPLVYVSQTIGLRLYSTGLKIYSTGLEKNSNGIEI